jgi:type IV secretion system protein TrbI
LAFDTQEKELAYKARFASNLAHSQSQNIHGPSSLIAASFPAQDQPGLNGGTVNQPYSPPGSNVVPTSSMVAPRTRGQDAPSADKRPAEVNINSASGQPYVVYEGTILETVLMNRLDGEGSRLAAAISPLVRPAPALVIRKFSSRRFTVEGSKTSSIVAR